MLGLVLILVLSSSLFVAVIWRTARFSCGLALASAVAGIVVSFGLGSPILLLQALGTCVAGSIVALRGGGARGMLHTALWAALFAYVVVGPGTVAKAIKRDRLRERYPVQSVANRLEYETRRHVPTASESGANAAPRLASAVQANLEKIEHRPFNSYRTWELRWLHREATNQFLLAPGFGVGRMRPPTFEIDDVPSTPVPQPSLESFEPGTSLARSGPLRQLAPPRDELLATHLGALFDFLDRDRMGYVAGRERVIGFEPHRFLNVPKIRPEADANVVNPAWQVARLELLSLLKYEGPRVYVSENLPRMDELKDAATRPLDGFEQQALERLRTTEDVVADEAGDVIRMLGSLRAGNDCLQCHEVRRGELLGAFSYRIVRTKPAAANPAKTPTQPQAARPQNPTPNGLAAGGG